MKLTISKCVNGNPKGSALVMVVVLTVLVFLTRAFLAGRGVDRVQPAAVLVGLTAGVLALGLAAATVPDPTLPLARLSLLLGLYAFLFVLVFSIGYRMLPFFTFRFLGTVPVSRRSWNGRRTQLATQILCTRRATLSTERSLPPPLQPL